ncbi:phosphoglycerate dehydrogenase [Candidatus Bipolaricaulota bacterium]|nr:phosphoglycerate dehydrogenase [Candidatus Bipolaricaulota bacterium]
MSEKEMVDYVSNRNIKGIIVGLDPISKEIIETDNSLEIISKYGTGLDNIDIKAAKNNGVTVTYTPGANTQSVADLTFGLILGVSRWIPTHDRRLRKGTLDRNQGREIWNKTLGIVGLGQIGSAVAKRAQGFNMVPLYYDLDRRETLETALGVEYRDFKDLIAESDFLTLHCPLNKSTRNLVGKSELTAMKDNSILINTARSGLIDEKALLEALKSDEIAGAAVDTFESEEALNTELFSLDNFVGSPHAGASTKESVLIMANMATDEVLNVLRGKQPAHIVPELCDN